MLKNEIATSQVCVLIRGDVELWIPADRQAELETALSDKDKRFIKINGQTVNSFEVLGIFTAVAMEERIRRRNGQWLCAKSSWHDKGQQCHCREYKEEVTAFVKGIGEVKYRR